MSYPRLADVFVGLCHEHPSSIHPAAVSRRHRLVLSQISLDQAHLSPKVSRTICYLLVDHPEDIAIVIVTGPSTALMLMVRVRHPGLTRRMIHSRLAAVRQRISRMDSKSCLDRC